MISLFLFTNITRAVIRNIIYLDFGFVGNLEQKLL